MSCFNLPIAEFSGRYKQLIKVNPDNFFLLLDIFLIFSNLEKNFDYLLNCYLQQCVPPFWLLFTFVSHFSLQTSVWCDYSYLGIKNMNQKYKFLKNRKFKNVKHVFLLWFHWVKRNNKSIDFGMHNYLNYCSAFHWFHVSLYSEL